MNEKSESELEEEIKSAWEKWAEENHEYISRSFYVMVKKNPTGRVKYSVKLESMYSYVPVSLSLLNVLASILDCKDVEEKEKYSSAGCETCDFGSSYEIEFYCW